MREVQAAAAPGESQETAEQKLVIGSSPGVPGAVWAGAGLGWGAARLLAAC